MTAAMILGAGLGTRLRPLTDWRAKPMVPLGDRPAVAHIADRLRAAGVDRIVVNVHHRPKDLRGWADRSNVAVSEEATLLGTAGGIARAAALIGEGDVLVWNGDVLATPNLGALMAAHRSEATLAITSRPAGEGNVGVAADGRIVRLRQESFGAEAHGGYFTGIHVVGAALRERFPRSGCIVGDVYLPALRAGARLEAHVLEGEFTDVGSLASYLAANRKWLGERDSWAAPDAVVKAPIGGSIIGAGARIDAPALACVVWPGATVPEPMSEAIVTPHGIARIA
jgi:mannose-1-phosphate guanylyltransferase